MLVELCAAMVPPFQRAGTTRTGSDLKPSNEVRAESNRFARQLEAHLSSENFLEQDPDLKMGEERPQAEVWPSAAEGHVGVGSPTYVEPLRVEHVLVEVRGHRPRGPRGLRLDGHAADLGVTSRRTAEVDDRRPVAKDLVDSGRDERRVGLDSGELIRVLHEGEDALRDPGPGRFVAGEDEELEEVHHRLVEPLSFDLGVHEPRDQVVGRVLAALAELLPPRSET